MEKVASHINEMQKIYEDYGTVFDQLVAEQSGTEKEVCGGLMLGCMSLGTVQISYLDFPGGDKAFFWY